MVPFSIQTKKVKVLIVKLEHVGKQIQDLITEMAIMKSCISNVNGLLSDIIKTRYPLITITLRKHLVENLIPVFTVVHLLEGFPDPSVISKQGGDQPKKPSTTLAKPTTSVKPSIKSDSEPNDKDKIFSAEPIVDNSDEEELDEEELKRRKAREAELDDNQLIVREDEAMEKAEKEARSALESRKILFPILDVKKDSESSC
ncbi:unnamed protein product [Lactuca saligna]|uniref:Uncharacterized protein n=1 Tax=Lactuca saligna TaxID=75948 RepID=A0AA36EM22_LACSI|nr:unnamed protein product [Lactuca saligna]